MAAGQAVDTEAAGRVVAATAVAGQEADRAVISQDINKQRSCFFSADWNLVRICIRLVVLFRV